MVDQRNVKENRNKTIMIMKYTTTMLRPITTTGTSPFTVQARVVVNGTNTAFVLLRTILVLLVVITSTVYYCNAFIIQPQMQRYQCKHHISTIFNVPTVPRYSTSIIQKNDDIMFGFTKIKATINDNDNDDGISIQNDEIEVINEPIDVSVDPRLYRVRLSRPVGIEWGTDLSFSFVYVRDIEPSGSASYATTEIKKGDQICEIIPISSNRDNQQKGAINLIGSSFDTVMSTVVSFDKSIRDIDFVFFRGTKDELIELCNNSNNNSDSSSIDTSANKEIDQITITVIQNDKNNKKNTINTNTNIQQQPTQVLYGKQGVNVRQILVDNNINVYRNINRYTNCKGKNLCGTCIVQISNGLQNTNRKSIDESSILRDNPESYRLSCITYAYGDITVETFPPV